jgi:eukaryotic-like serine/threonine-protein kinase
MNRSSGIEVSSTFDTGKAAAFLRAYQRAMPGDPWASSKAEPFRALGLA